MLLVVQTTFHHTEAQRDKLRLYVTAELAEGTHVVVLPVGCSMDQLSAPMSAAYVVQTESHQTSDQLSSVRESVRTQLGDSKKVVVLPPSYAMKVLSSQGIAPVAVTANGQVADEARRHYEAIMRELKAPPARSIITLTRRCWPARLWLSYKGWRKDMGVLDSLRAAWRVSR